MQVEHKARLYEVITYEFVPPQHLIKITVTRIGSLSFSEQNKKMHSRVQSLEMRERESIILNELKRRMNFPR